MPGSDVFLSYATQDRETARLFAHALEESGYSVWWDRTILPGRSFDKVIEAELTSAKCVVVLWSDASVEKHWVKTEAAEALHRDVLVPVSIGAERPPLQFRHLQTASLADWKGNVEDAQFQLMLQAIAEHVGSRTDPSPGAETGQPENVEPPKVPTKRKGWPAGRSRRQRQLVYSTIAAIGTIALAVMASMKWQDWRVWAKEGPFEAAIREGIRYVGNGKYNAAQEIWRQLLADTLTREQKVRVLQLKAATYFPSDPSAQFRDTATTIIEHLAAGGLQAVAATPISHPALNALYASVVQRLHETRLSDPVFADLVKSAQSSFDDLNYLPARTTLNQLLKLNLHEQQIVRVLQLKAAAYFPDDAQAQVRDTAIAAIKELVRMGVGRMTEVDVAHAGLDSLYASVVRNWEGASTWHVVEMRRDRRGARFEPRNLIIKAGDGVRWNMVSGAPHNVEFQNVPPGAKTTLAEIMGRQAYDLAGPFLLTDTWSYTLSFRGVKPGRYDYVCASHSMNDMRGSITVQ